MKTCAVVELSLDTFLTSALDGGEWSAFRSGRFTSGERAPNTHCIEGCVGHRTGLEYDAKIPWYQMKYANDINWDG